MNYFSVPFPQFSIEVSMPLQRELQFYMLFPSASAKTVRGVTPQWPNSISITELRPTRRICPMIQFLLALLFLASTSPLKLQCKPLLLSCTPQTLPEKVLQCHQSLLGWNVWEVVCSKTWASESNRLGSSSQEVCLCSFRLLVGKVETVVVWRWVSMARAWLQAHGKYSTNIDNLQPMPPFPVMILDTTQPNPVTLQTEDTRPLSESSGLVTQCRVAYSQPAEPQRAEGTCPCSQILDARPPCTALPLITKALPGLSLIHSATPPMPFMN